MREIKFRWWNGKAMIDNDNILCLVKNMKSPEYMQFTGLTDRNGVEIYEGDVAKDHVGIGEVKYSYKHGAFRVCYGDGMAKWFIDYNLRGERESIEVIGNIHQDPELLDSVKQN